MDESTYETEEEPTTETESEEDETQITISQEGKSAHLLKSFLAKSKEFPT